MTRTYTLPQTWVTGSTPGATEMNREIRDNLQYAFQPAHASVYVSGDDVVGDISTNVAVDWTTVLQDADSMWSGGAATRLTVPTGWAGLWDIRAQVTLKDSSANADWVRLPITLRKNGTTFAKNYAVGNSTELAYVTTSASCHQRLAVGDYVDVLIGTSTAFRYDTVYGGKEFTFFEMTWRGI